jgi:hypothetical protein
VQDVVAVLTSTVVVKSGRPQGIAGGPPFIVYAYAHPSGWRGFISTQGGLV